MDQDGTRPGYTTLVSPGVTQIQSGQDVNPEKIAIFVNAISGDIDILQRMEILIWWERILTSKRMRR